MIKASKTTENIVSISISDAIELIRNYLNQHGSREAGVNIAIPENAKWQIFNLIYDDEAIQSKDISFSWVEKL